MKFKSIQKIIIAITVLIIFNGCRHIAPVAKFNQAGWKLTEDLNAHPNRERMLDDLIAHHTITGLTCHQLIDSLGKPDNYCNLKDSLRYDIFVNYGPPAQRSGKYLAIGFNKDSTTTGFRVVEWRNRQTGE